MGLRELSKCLLIHSNGKNVKRQMLCPSIPHQNRKPIDFFDSVVRDRNASDGCTVSVEIDCASQIWPETQDPVRAIRVIDVHAQKEIALRIEEVEIVEALRN